MATTKIRVATVKATGKRYIVNSISFARTATGDIDRAASKVLCWGELRSARSGVHGRWVHDASKTFLLDAVEMVETERDEALMHALWRQSVAALDAAGRLVSVSRSGRTVTVRR